MFEAPRDPARPRCNSVTSADSVSKKVTLTGVRGEDSFGGAPPSTPSVECVAVEDAQKLGAVDDSRDAEGDPVRKNAASPWRDTRLPWASAIPLPWGMTRTI